MATTRNPVTAAEEPTDGGIPPPETPPSPTVTHYQKLATDFIVALDQIATIIPKSAERPASAEFVRAYRNIPLQFLATTTSSVEQNRELQSVGKLDVVRSRDTLQFLEAFRPVLDKVSNFTRSLRFTMSSRKAFLAFDALQVYDIAKGIARNSTEVEALAANMKRDLGRTGPSKAALALKKAAAAAGAGVLQTMPAPAKPGWEKP